MTAAQQTNGVDTTEAPAVEMPTVKKANRNLTVAEWRTVYAGRREELKAAVDKQDWARVQSLSITLQRVMNAAAKAALAEAQA